MCAAYLHIILQFSAEEYGIACYIYVYIFIQFSTEEQLIDSTRATKLL
jgi:hypothetical protein